jgi:hypothetical protein
LRVDSAIISSTEYLGARIKELRMLLDVEEAFLRDGQFRIRRGSLTEYDGDGIAYLEKFIGRY